MAMGAKGKLKGEAVLPFLDHAILNQLVNDVSKEAMTSLLLSLHTEIANTYIKLQECVAQEDMAKVALYAHALKSAAGGFGAMRLSNLCNMIEEGVRTQSSQDVLNSYLALFNDVVVETQAALAAVKLQ